MEISNNDLPRMQEAIMIVLYEQHPMPMMPNHILDVIEERGLLYMSDEQFENYRKEIIKSKEN